MVGTAGKNDQRAERPVRKTKPTAILLQHSEKAALPSQQKAINNFRAMEAAKQAAEHDNAAVQSTLSTPTSWESSFVPSTPPATLASQITDADIWDVYESIGEDTEDEERENACINPKPSKGKYNWLRCVYNY